MTHFLQRSAQFFLASTILLATTALCATPALARPAHHAAKKPAPVAEAEADTASYKVKPGDTLAKIAKKFYGSSKNSDIARIVKANPAILKDATTPLVVSKKLTIPGVKAVPAPVTKMDPGLVAPPSGPLTPTLVNVDPSRKVEKPVGSLTKVDPPAMVQTTTASSKVYVVQPGDTLEKIAKKIAPSKVNETVAKIMALNGIKNAESLQVSTKLKLPV